MAKRRSFTAEDSCVLHRPDGYPGRFPARAMTLATRAFLFGTNTKKGGAPGLERGPGARGDAVAVLRPTAGRYGGYSIRKGYAPTSWRVSASMRQRVDGLMG